MSPGVLACIDHNIRQCLLDAYEVHECPNCSSELLTTAADGTQQLLCTLHNEGGVQEDLDILPLLTEEAYLKTYPEERKARAFLEFCREGDLQAIIGMIKDDDGDDVDEAMEDEQGQRRVVDILRYQDPLGDMQSGLHAAVQAQSREVAWLLLLLTSNLDLMQFPPEVFQEAAAVGLMRPEEPEDKVDIRSLKDAQGKTAEQLAEEIGGVWNGWFGTGRLAV
jgi:hypothetical protein